jgi:hypothetical protein
MRAGRKRQLEVLRQNVQSAFCGGYSMRLDLQSPSNAPLASSQSPRLAPQGSLVQVLEGKVGGETRIVMAYPEREFMPAAVRTFADVLGAWAATEIERYPAAQTHRGAAKTAR